MSSTPGGRSQPSARSSACGPPCDEVAPATIWSPCPIWRTSWSSDEGITWPPSRLELEGAARRTLPDQVVRVEGHAEGLQVPLRVDEPGIERPAKHADRARGVVIAQQVGPLLLCPLPPQTEPVVVRRAVRELRGVRVRRPVGVQEAEVLGPQPPAQRVDGRASRRAASPRRRRSSSQCCASPRPGRGSSAAASRRGAGRSPAKRRRGSLSPTWPRCCR